MECKSNKYYKLFKEHFNSLASKYSSHYVFDDFLDLFINGFSFDYTIDLEKIQIKYTKDERLSFGMMISNSILILNDYIKNDSDWFDFLGSYYEYEGIIKKKGYAQFFTPAHVCTLMVHIAFIEKNNLKKLNFSDPCCGSGRFSLASNSVNLGMFHVLVDKDYTCAKISAINLMLHGINGIVVCDDSLFPGNSFRGAFIINRNLPFTKIPQIEFIDNKNNAYNYIKQQLLENNSYKKVSKISTKDDFSDIKDIFNKQGQYAMF